MISIIIRLIYIFIPIKMWVVKKCFNLIKLEQLYGKNDIPEKNVISYLRQRNPRLKMDLYGNLYLINPWTPILNAHMDTVQGKSDTKWCTKKLKLKKDKISAKNCIIWWDDKCWIAIAMQLYEEMWDKISLLFTRQEEVWCLGIKEFVKNQNNLELLKQAPYALTLDRRWSWDIIWESNWYCSKEFEDRIHEITKPYWYKPEHWLCSDANTISSYINVVNLSVGYYNPHTNKEYIDCKDMINAMEAVREIINTIKPTEKFPSPDEWKVYYPTSVYNYNKKNTGSLFDSYYDDDYYGRYDKEKSFYSRYEKDDKNSSKTSSETAKTNTSEKEEIKNNIKTLLKFFDYDEKEWILTIKRNIEVWGIDWDMIEEIFDLPKWKYYLYEYVDDIIWDTDEEAIKQTYWA